MYRSHCHEAYKKVAESFSAYKIRARVREESTKGYSSSESQYAPHGSIYDLYIYEEQLCRIINSVDYTEKIYWILR